MRLNNIIINDNSTIRDAMERLSICGLGTIFVIDNSKKLVGIITDGDIRRQILIDNDLSINIKSLMNRNYFCLDIHNAWEYLEWACLPKSILLLVRLHIRELK